MDLKFVTIWKIKFKYFLVGGIFLQVFGFFFQALQYQCDEHFNIIFFVNGIFFHT